MPRRFLFRLFHAAQSASEHVPDAELLRRYARDRDSAAFELLVRRHADSVWAACWRVLRNDADADDAFQAAFLVLARKAGSVRNACVGGWLHRVAVNAALKLRARRAPGVNPGVLESTPGLTPGARQESDERAAVVHQELARLPERYRLPVVLCDLEGQTHAEAAKALNWPIGSVSGRLSRAHALLRDRLTRRGIAAPAALVAVLSTESAPVRAVTSALNITAGSLPVPPVVSTLTEGVLSAMRIAKLKLVAAVVAVSGLLGLAGTGTVALLAQPPAPDVESGTVVQPKPAAKWEAPPVVETAEGSITAFPDLTRENTGNLQDAVKKCPLILGDKDLAVDPGNTTYTKLLKARVNALRQVLKREFQVIAIGRANESTYSTLADVTDRLISVMNELEGGNLKALLPWAQERVVILRTLEVIAENRVKVGTSPPQTADLVRERRLAAETDLLLAMAAAEKPARPAGGPTR